MKTLYTWLALCFFLLFSLEKPAAQNLSATIGVMYDGECNLTCSTSLTAFPIGGAMPYTYDWSNDGPDFPDNDPPTLDFICAGTYTVTITDANGATATATSTVAQTSMALTYTATAASCFGACNGSVNLIVSGGFSPYEYIWSNNANTEDLIGICSGTYTVTVTDSHDCTKSLSATVASASGMTLSTCISNVTCFGINTGKIDLTVTGGAMPYTYLWSNGSTTQDLTNIPAGTYTPTVVDGNGCNITTSATVSQPPSIITTLVVASGNIDLSVTGGTPPYALIWSNGSTAQDLYGFGPGTYCVTVTDSGGCTKTDCATISGTPGSLTINGQVLNADCGGQCSGTIYLSVNGGIGSYIYKWSGPNSWTSTTQNVYSACPGTYCVTVTSATGITASACYTVGQNLTHTLDIKSTSAAFCNYNDPSIPPVCEKVCPHSKVTYFVELPTNCGIPIGLGNINWNVFGYQDVTSNNPTEVTVTWGEPGAGLVRIGTDTSCTQGVHCVTIVEEPEAKFSTDPPFSPNTPLQLCKGQTVSFKNESLNADVYQWIFSDNLSIVTDANTIHTYPTPGHYTVTLIARSFCLCADTIVLPIDVINTEPPLLDCVGSVCPGETVKYTTSSNCSSYTWAVSPNGTVLEGGNAVDNSITVQWGQGTSGTISLSASGCGGAACPQASVFNIPIISDNAEIRGNETVCPESQEEYSIDLFDGTSYNWTLSSGGIIIQGQLSNKVTVSWSAQANANTTHWLSVDYYNCYLGCGGEDSIPVKILSPFIIQGAVEMCDNLPGNYKAKLSTGNVGVASNWTIYLENGTVYWTSPNATSVMFFPANTPPGKYRIVAVPAAADQTCSASAETMVNVVAKPPKPAVISGPTVICPGTPIAYEVFGNAPYSVHWDVFNGTPSAQAGNPANITWLTNPARWLSATYVSNDGLGCRSDSAKLNISGISGLSITGVPDLCEGAVGYYSADAYPGFDYQWEIIPANAGAIKTGQGKNAVEIFWQSPGNHTLRVTTCSISSDFSVNVWPNPEPMVTHPAGLCPGATGLVTTTAPYIAYSWQTATGTPLSTSATANVMAGANAVEVTDAHGCKGSSDFTIALYPTPNVSLTTADPTGICNNSPSVSLTALVPDNGVFSYNWFKDGVSLGVNVPVYATNQYGQYTVVATNAYGCTADAPPIAVFEYCGSAGGGGVCTNPPGGGSAPLCAPGSVQAVPDPTTRCDSIRLVLNDYTGQYVPGSAEWWTGISGGIQIATASGDNASFIYPNAGKYIVLVAVHLQDGSVCVALDSIDIEAVAQFSQRLACPGDSTRFIDESTRLPEANIVGWQWDFGDAGTADMSSLASPGYPFANPGNYTATLTVTTASGCTSTYSESVFVPAEPVPTFTPPLANCAGNASDFALSNAAGIIKTAWDFGHPASGALNQTEGSLVYHNYTPAGNYPVTVTATNTYGCIGAKTLPVNIVNNPFSGNITPATAVMCEGKTITLTAPSGANASYVWSDGTNLQTLTVDQEGVYDVTLTNGNGCTYSPAAKNVEVNPAPVGVIKALEINDLGQVTGVSYPTLSVCAGQDVNLQIQDNGTYTYQWSGGNGTDEILIFSEDRHNLLSVGTHIFTVTVTNPTTGCTAVLAPFQVDVHPVPAGFSVSSNSVCAGTPATISYSGLQPPNWQILWNTGEVGPTMTTEEAGLYFVRVVNEFGCSTQSNTVVIFPGPNVAALPAGCHERCNPDTLCIPVMANIVSWQWFFEGNPIPGATSSHFAATQSGTYYAEMLDMNGCHAQSADLTVELYDGFGNILGQVWSDVNHNGMVDGADTLVAAIPVQLLQNGGLINTGISGADGGFNWQNVPATGYLVQIDTQSLGSQWEVVIPSDSVGLTGCGGKAFADLLVSAYQCPPLMSNIALTACADTPVLFNGTPVLAGQSHAFHFQSYLGCDSIVTVNVTALPTSASTLNAKTCPGSTYSYQGVSLTIGQTQAFTLTNALGCDSIVTVNVTALPTSASTLNAKTCPGATYSYQGVNLAVGQTQAFTLTNALGCDSIVTVNVTALPTSASTLIANICPGTSYSYQGTSLAIGQTQAFTLTNALGCDSIVSVSVSALPTSASTLNAKTCPGTTYSYHGANLAIGQTQVFTLTNALGCDSIVTVSVGALPTSTGATSFGVCPHETYTYQGQALPPGTVQDFTLTNWLGCDSIVTVTVFEKASSAEIREVSVCPGQAYVYNGEIIAIGQTKDIHFSNGEGCDSLVTIHVTAWPALDFTVDAQNSCPTAGTGAISIAVVPGGSNPTGFALNGIDYQPNTKFDSLVAGNYTVSVQDENGCIWEKPAAVAASPNLALSLPGAYLIPCDSARITLAPAIGGDTAGLRLTWWNGAQTPSVTVDDATPVWIDATNHCGETLHREAEVNWANSDGEPLNIYVPNIFAPTAKNAENTMFRAFFGNNFTLLKYRIEVYDRWGNMLFTSDRPEVGWTGPFRDKIMDPGVYVWQLWVKLAFCGREIELYKKGDVMVER